MDFVEQKSLRKEKRLKKNITETKSVLQAHYEKLEYFEKLQTVVLPKKQKLFSQGKCLKKEIDDIVARKEETEYHLDTAHIISEFIDLESTPMIFNESNEINKYNNRRNELIFSYFTATREHQYVKHRKLVFECATKCKHCSEEMSELSEGFICTGCGLCDSTSYISDIPSYTDSQQYEKKITIDYKRINYFTEWLNQIQAKEHTEIPESLKDALILELKKEKVTDMKKLNNSMVKRLLKKCGFSKFYEHIPLIINSLNGIKPLKMPKSIEDRLKFMFKEIQEPWEIHKPETRHNFFSYPYIICKFCQILEINEFLGYFTLLKSREKLYNQDVIWKKIVTELAKKKSERHTYQINWRFIPSV